MARSIPDDPGFEETPSERVARYWKNAALAYHNACTSDAAEAKALYQQLAMTWAALATELEREAVLGHHVGQSRHPIRPSRDS